MGLLSTEVEVGLYGKNIQYYESLGYKIPRRKARGKICIEWGSTLKVKIEDLLPHSGVLVDVECDCCKEHLKVQYNAYNRYKREEKYYCGKCASKLFNSGENNYLYNPNITDEERELKRNYSEYLEFVKSVMARDNYTCQCCGHDSHEDYTYLEVHHLYGYAGFPEYRIDQTQAVTLCKKCHKAFHNWHHEKFGYANSGSCTKKQYEEWIGYAICELEKYNGTLSSARKVYDYESNKIYDSAIECSKILGTDNTAVYNCCNHKKVTVKYISKVNGTITYSQKRVLSAKGHHLFWLDEYEKMTQEEINEFVNATHKLHSRNKK